MTIKTLSTEDFLGTEAAKAFFSPRFSDNSVEESVKTILENDFSTTRKIIYR